MEQNKLKKMAITISIIASCIIAAVVVAEHGRRRRKKRRAPAKKSCYLENEVKPQSHFKRLLADNSYTSFNHLNINDISSNSHPYEREIKTLLQNPEVESSIFDNIVKTGMDEPHIWVESESELRQLVHVLSHQKVFAVDTEQHSLRSFLGFTALVQISTQKEDYLVDTIALHDVMDILRPVFADPSILKVFHGSDNDVLWLQRDFHIYVVNLFDTAKACEVLSKPQKSLAYLLDSYCGATTNKLFQREDWRQRPLPEEMVDYARSDAHYLLYIARCLIEELGAKENNVDQQKVSIHGDGTNQLLSEASRRSHTTCLQLYWKEDEGFPGESVASSILSRNLACRGTSPKFCEEQFQNHVRKLCAWGDLMARVHDESLRYVLSDQAIIALAVNCPSSDKDIYSTIFVAEQENDSSTSLVSPSPIICSHWDDVQCLLEDTHSDCDIILQKLLQKHIGPNGTCSLSVYNYNLLSKSNLKFANGTFALQSGVKNGKSTTRKSSRDLFVQKFSCKAPVYHNCRIYANDHRLLCYCDRRKLEWYLNRNLAKLVDDDPPAIMLLFEPKGRPEDEDNDFYIQSKRNMCVGCGESKHYLRYRIIPSCYRVHFPEHLKSHRSHDIVLLCVDCHEIARAAAEKYKRRIATEFGVPLYVKKMVDSSQIHLGERPKSDAHEEAGVSPLQLRIAAMALLRHGPRMPSKRHDELIEIVRTYYRRNEITSEDLEAALLVGMSSRGRRKFEKKKGASRTQSSVSIISDKVQEDTEENTPAPISLHSEEPSALDESLDIQDQTSYLQISDKSSEFKNKENASAGGAKPVASASSETSEVKDLILSDAGAEIGESNSLPSEGITSLDPNPDGKKVKSKASLLGHGPHGKQVVELLLNEHGDDGIQQFCQRWRQVFIDAVHPRYLPAGWDIKHSGRRDFGEFSVYNPIKKSSGETQ